MIQMGGQQPGFPLEHKLVMGFLIVQLANAIPKEPQLSVGITSRRFHPFAEIKIPSGDRIRHRNILIF